MDKEEKALRKIALLSNAINQVNEQEDALDELKAASFEALLLNPGSEFGDWQQTLIYEYPAEVADAYGCDPDDAVSSLSDLWETPYEDTASGLEYTFETWAQCFCNEAAVQMYYDFIEKLKNVSAM